ncbi:macrolide phosphotransferase [Austwickia chelonae]|uniref:Aminoglycoside phosphotransferase domain-containing protein n=1 Tax=Austwickia chelonae NBRC 105200 TaxID=1184607 RepID=K6W7D8_9MICO|nr:phosphotransferase [Austwickia chelonae]GAB77742.1 hypothetical protein AUCHE_06_00140 [Austwickia chelonae NBRC 105200]SEV88653.1 macrolide phosphotransferase [Austwickia chelonae]
MIPEALEDAEEDARAVLDMWGMDEPLAKETSGLNKDTWQVGERHWLAADRVDVQNLWRTVDELLGRHELAGYDLPRALPATTGEPLVHFRGRLWRLTESVNGVVPVASRVADLESVAVGMARLHAAMAPLPQRFGAAAVSSETYAERARQFLEHAALPFSTEEHSQVCEGLRLWDKRPRNLIAPQVIHGDPSYPNLRCNADCQLTGLIDWESVRWDSPLYDLAVVGQTVFFRSGWQDTLKGLDRLLTAYARSGGREYAMPDLLHTLLGIKLESVAHHGQKLLDGHGDADLVRSQAGKIYTISALLNEAAL